VNDSGKNLRIGNTEPGGFGPADGTLDDVRYYDAALSSTQISNIVANTQP